jgi:glycosyltransferase involved in cell wall biosynthesis
VPAKAKATKHEVIPNGIDLFSFKLRPQSPGTKTIGMIASTRWEKNHALAALILMLLPEEYTIRCIGMPGNASYACCISEYISSLGLADRFIMDGLISPAQVPTWLEDKDCLLSCSISEGNPMNVLEAMAMGVQPVIHAWPGATDQFNSKWIYKTPGEAAEMIMHPTDTPETYRKWIADNYNLDNYKRLRDAVNAIC